MSHRTQITLEDAQYARLLAESRASGLGLAELIRRAVDRTYGGADPDEFEAALDGSFGTWGPDAPDGEEHSAAELWTRNIKHFPMFDGLTPPY